ncbi:LUD domain-containing protein [Polaribacter vadi]|uniref:LUD domain-containing protein n=1 Tax=Polaribacter TaxID=52959 RepID=UPI001C090B97|nr:MULTISPECIES: LUD domain-containing protein [Polaribacter]MBU3012923.1 LUD domain-containing protein [Polaribacter vadi]MDO6742741.1 LUD domain-containing protein [Polaribacter sp. 1_MG-2023]
MNFFKKIFSIPDKEEEEVQKQEVNLALDDLFAHNFVEKGGKFLYCINNQEVIANFKKVIAENNWKNIFLLDDRLSSLLKTNDLNIVDSFNDDPTIFTSCEHLIADKGEILFSSNQLKSTRLKDFPDNFIVFATTSQLVKDTNQGLTGIKTKFKKDLPTNISSIKNYNSNNSDDNFLNYGNNNSKNLYLLLLEDL